MSHPDQARPPSALPTPAAPTLARSRFRPATWALVGLTILAASSAAWGSRRARLWQGEDPLLRLPKALVSRVDLSSVVTASGRVESSHNTVIACELERLEMRSEGQSVGTGGASTVLWIIPEGSDVKKGDVLCRLDASEYEELVRQQLIKLEQARAILATGRLNLEVAELAVREYRDGLMKRELQTLEGQIALSESTLERTSDRLRWTDRMLVKGYVAVSAKASAIRDEKMANLELLKSRWTLRNLRLFGIPMALMQLESEVEKRRFEVIANGQRVTRTEERLKHYQLMLGRCTIRAPHDGFVIYAGDPNKRSTGLVEAGSRVRQSQELFYLPDMGRMRVMANLHESVAHRVRDGMRARIKVEGLGNRVLEGHVVSVAPLPTGINWFSDEVKYFVAAVEINSAPRGILPGMTAEVEIDDDRRLDVLAVPSEAVAVEGGSDVCYVAGLDGLRRRPVTLGRSDRDLLEVTNGLAEGEEVIMNPSKVDALDTLVVRSSPTDEAPEATPGDAPGAGPGPVGVD